jgi:chromosome partitioning protein
MAQLKVAIMSNAGGTGKTTLAINIANELDLAGHSVCLFGLDPNASLAMFLGLLNPAEKEQTLSAVLEDEFDGKWPLFDCWTEKGSRVQACLSGEGLGDAIERLSNTDRRTEVLQDRLEDFPLPHDFLIFDCPGTVDLLHKVALTACDYVLIPVQPDAKGVYAVATLLTWFFQQVKRLRLRPAPKILGVVPNRVQTTVQHQDVLGLREERNMGDMPTLPDLLKGRGVYCFAPIREYADISKSIMDGMPLKAYRPAHKANALFKGIAHTLVEKKKEAS